MAKEILGLIKLQIPAGGANPSPPVGPALGQRGLNIMDFCKAFNDKTKNIEKGAPIPVVITAYKDRSFEFDIEKIAKEKMNDLNAIDLEGATNMVKGSALSMGMEVIQ